jgi:hypothetical protein
MPLATAGEERILSPVLNRQSKLPFEIGDVEVPLRCISWRYIDHSSTVDPGAGWSDAVTCESHLTFCIDFSEEIMLVNNNAKTVKTMM